MFCPGELPIGGFAVRSSRPATAAPAEAFTILAISRDRLTRSSATQTIAFTVK